MVAKKKLSSPRISVGTWTRSHALRVPSGTAAPSRGSNGTHAPSLGAKLGSVFIALTLVSTVFSCQYSHVSVSSSADALLPMPRTNTNSAMDRKNITLRFIHSSPPIYCFVSSRLFLNSGGVKSPKIFLRTISSGTSLRTHTLPMSSASTQ